MHYLFFAIKTTALFLLNYLSEQTCLIFKKKCLLKTRSRKKYVRKYKAGIF